MQHFTLRSISSKCCDYLRNVKGIPLPCVSTLNEKVKNFPCEPGSLCYVLSLMKPKAETLNTVERVAVLSFDEMSIASEWSYDKGSDTLYKPHDKDQDWWVIENKRLITIMTCRITRKSYLA